MTFFDTHVNIKKDQATDKNVKNIKKELVNSYNLKIKSIKQHNTSFLFCSKNRVKKYFKYFKKSIDNKKMVC